LPGLVQTYTSARNIYDTGPFTSPDRAAAIRWIYAHTSIQSRVAEFRAAEAGLATDTDFLRTGNRAGLRPYDRSHALVGYVDYSRRMRNVATGIAVNDFILVAKKDDRFLWFLTTCGAPAAFQNKSQVLYRIDDGCRSRLRDPSLRDEFVERQKQIERIASLGADANALQTLAKDVVEHPEAVGKLRTQLERLWAGGKFAAAADILEPVLQAHPRLAEAHYSYAFSLQCGRIDLPKAVDHYTAALENGYAEFWIRYNRGTVYLELKQYDRARKDLERARVLDPRHEGVQTVLSRLPHRSRDRKKAVIVQ
jgi:tetratricopeptide (TPR) repeat protein